MAMIKVGADAFGTEYTPIPTGTKVRMTVFDFEVVQVGSGEHQGKERLQVTTKVTEDSEFKGREIRYNNIPLYSDKKTDWVLVAFAEAMGWKTSKEEGVDVPDNFQSILGTEFIGTVGQRTSPTNNNVYNTVKGYAKLPAGGGDTPQPKKASWGDV